MYARLLQVEDAATRFDLSSLRLCVSSGESLPPALFHAWRERFGQELPKTATGKIQRFRLRDGA